MAVDRRDKHVSNKVPPKAVAPNASALKASAPKASPAEPVIEGSAVGERKGVIVVESTPRAATTYPMAGEFGEGPTRKAPHKTVVFLVALSLVFMTIIAILIHEGYSSDGREPKAQPKAQRQRPIDSVQAR